MVTFDEALKAVAINRSIAHRNNDFFRNAELRMKHELICEAISYPGTTPLEHMTYTEVWTDGHHSVMFGKYGKEYYREVKKNKNDMAPTIFCNGKVCDYDASFRAIFRLSEELKKNGDEKSLLLLGCLFVRNAFLVDHHQISNVGIRYVIPELVKQYLEKSVVTHAGIPIIPFLMYVDAIAWQEDVKYTTLGKKETSDIGRKNNMLTYARFVACLLGRSSYAEMLNKFSMGVSALPKKEISTVFPELKTSY